MGKKEENVRRDRSGNPQIKKERSARSTLRNRGRNIDAVLDAIENPRSSANRAGGQAGD